jgi:hypothetical protein
MAKSEDQPDGLRPWRKRALQIITTGRRIINIYMQPNPKPKTQNPKLIINLLTYAVSDRYSFHFPCRIIYSASDFQINLDPTLKVGQIKITCSIIVLRNYEPVCN